MSKELKLKIDLIYSEILSLKALRIRKLVNSQFESPCSGESEIVGVALDGFPIWGPGLNPETGFVWSQSDMDVCGGREDTDGNYGYYVTVDFPYILQCYRGDTSKTIPAPRGKVALS